MEVRTCYKTAKYDECRRFYEVILEWPIFKEWDRSPRDRGVVYAIGGAFLELLVATEATATKFDNSFYLYVESTELEHLWARLQRAGLAPTPIQSYEWGHRTFVTKDPCGFVLKFFAQVS